jgi:hypothetical protein
LEANVPKASRASRVSKIPVKALVADALTDCVAENREELAGLSQAQTDTLLRRLLMRKLGMGAPVKTEKEKRPKPPKPKKKKKARRKYKVREPSSSEESSSDDSSE